jgi:hypothetical protein
MAYEELFTDLLRAECEEDLTGALTQPLPFAKSVKGRCTQALVP